MKFDLPFISFSVSLFSFVFTKTVELSRFPSKKQSSSPSSSKEQFSSKQGLKNNIKMKSLTQFFDYEHHYLNLLISLVEIETISISNPNSNIPFCRNEFLKIFEDFSTMA